MANEIKLKRGSGSNPSASDLVVGEVALRTDNGKLFTKKDDNSVTEIGSGISVGVKGDITVSSSGATFTIDNGAVTNAKLGDDSVTAAKIDSSAVTTAAIATDAVTSAKIADGAVDAARLASNAVTSAKINNGAVTNSKLGDDSITAAKIDNGAVGTDALATDAVTQAKIADGAVNAARLADDAVINAKVASDAAIAGTKISPDFGSQNITTSGGVVQAAAMTIQAGTPALNFTETDADPDYRIILLGGQLRIQDVTNSYANRFLLSSDGTIDVENNLNVGAGLDVTGEITGTSHIDLPDDAKIKLGNSDDLELYHTGGHSIIHNDTGYLRLMAAGSGVTISNGDNTSTMATFVKGGAVEIYHNNSKKFETTSDGATLTGRLSPAADDSYGLGQASLRWANLFLSGDIDLLDNDKVKFGNSDDMQIYHNSSNSFIDNTNGNLEIRSNEVRIKDYSEGDNMIYASRDGEVRLYFAGSEKLNTTNTGIEVTGNAIITGDIGVGTSSPESFGGGYKTLEVAGSTDDNGGVFKTATSGAAGSGAGGREMLMFTDAEGGSINVTTAHILKFSTSNTLRMKINSDGNLVITGSAAGEGTFASIENTTSAPAGVHLKSGHGNWSLYNSKTIADHIEFRDESSNTTVMTLNPSHDLGMGDGTNIRTQIVSDHSDAANASNRRGFHVTDGPALCHGGGGNASDRCFEAWSAHGGQAGSNFAKTAFQVLSDGSVKSKNNSYGQISDEKLKQDIVDSPSQWNDIKAVKVKKFRFIEEVTNLGEDKAVTQIGVVAQDLEAAGMNGLVYNTPDVIDNVDQGTVTKSVKYSVLNIKAIKALQEAMTRIETLESEVATLKAA